MTGRPAAGRPPRRTLASGPVIVLRDGEILPDRLRRERMSEDDLKAAAHAQGPRRLGGHRHGRGGRKRLDLVHRVFVKVCCRPRAFLNSSTRPPSWAAAIVRLLSSPRLTNSTRVARWPHDEADSYTHHVMPTGCRANVRGSTRLSERPVDCGTVSRGRAPLPLALALMAAVTLVVTVLPGTGSLAHAASPPCGRTWTIVPSPNPDPGHNTLNDVERDLCDGCLGGRRCLRRGTRGVLHP